MSLISAKLTDKIYFSYEEKIQNNFSFEITYSVDDSQIYNNLIKSISENDTLSIYIEGLQKLFKKKDELNNFAKALKAKNLVKGWNVLYDDDGLIITHSADILKNDFSILFNTEYEFNADFNDNDSILIKVYFYFPASTEDPIHQNFSIKVYELPYIDSLTATNSKGKETQSIIKGHTAKIHKKTNISGTHQGSAILYDETRTTPLEGNEVTIEKDCKFTLVVTKHEKEISRDISIKAVYIEKIDILDSDGNNVKAIYKGEKAKINWSLINGENAKVSLLDETGNEINPNEIIIDKNRTLTLKIEVDGDIATEPFQIYRTLWKKDQCALSIPFKADNKGYNKIHNRLSNFNRYEVFIHPKVYCSNNFLEWFIHAEDPNPLKDFDYYLYLFENPNEFSKLTLTITYVNRLNNNKTFKYLYGSSQWRNGTTLSVKNENNIVMSQGKYILLEFDAYEHSIIIRALTKIFPPSGSLSSISMPDDAKIISFDTLFIEIKKWYLVVLCNNKHVYVYKITLEKDNGYNLIRSFNFDRSNQKRVYLIQTDSIYVVLDNYVFELNGNEELSDINFSPLDTITKGHPFSYLIGEKDNKTFSMIVQDDDKTYLWNYG